MQQTRRLIDKLRSFFFPKAYTHGLDPVDQQAASLAKEVNYYQVETLRVLGQQARIRMECEKLQQAERNQAVSAFHKEFEEIFLQYSRLLATHNCEQNPDFMNGLKAIQDQFSSALERYKSSS